LVQDVVPERDRGSKECDLTRERVRTGRELATLVELTVVGNFDQTTDEEVRLLARARNLVDRERNGLGSWGDEKHRQQNEGGKNQDENPRCPSERL
jgi:hypothetical protein